MHPESSFIAANDVWSASRRLAVQHYDALGDVTTSVEFVATKTAGDKAIREAEERKAVDNARG